MKRLLLCIVCTTFAAEKKEDLPLPHNQYEAIARQHIEQNKKASSGKQEWHKQPVLTPQDAARYLFDAYGSSEQCPCTIQ